MKCPSCAAGDVTAFVAGAAVDRDQAWRDFAGWRVNYDTVVTILAGFVLAPYAPWISDRSPAGRHRPPILMRRRRRPPA